MAEAVVFDPRGERYTASKFSGRALSDAVLKFRPTTAFASRETKRHVWLEMKELGFRCEWQADQATE